jgi:hypothetical protein
MPPEVNRGSRGWGIHCFLLCRGVCRDNLGFVPHWAQGFVVSLSLSHPGSRRWSSNAWFLGEAIDSYEFYFSMVNPGKEPSSIVGFSKASRLQASVTHYECCLATSLKMGGGLKKQQFLAGGARGFSIRSPDVSPSDHVFPALMALAKATATSAPKVKA